MILFTIDVEPDIHTGEYKGITKGLARAEKLFRKHKISPILFVTCDCIERYPKFFRRLKKSGWELSLHGFRHVRFDNLSYLEKQEQVEKSLKCFKKYLNLKPKGFRAPQHSIDNQTLDILEKYNFEYDSSYTPLNLLQLFFFPRKFKLWIKHFISPRNPYKIRSNLYEIPPSALLFPFVSLLIRVFPLFLVRAYIKILKRMYKNPIFYCHSWDFIKIPKSKIDKQFSHEIFIKRLDKLLEDEKTKNT